MGDQQFAMGGGDMEPYIGLNGTDDAWIAVMDTNVQLVAKMTLQSLQADNFDDLFLVNQELYIDGTYRGELLNPWRCEAADTVKIRGMVFKPSLSALGINDPVSPAAIMDLFPNPASSELTIRIKNEEVFSNASVRITDVSGKVLFKAEYKRLPEMVKVNCSAWNSGTYFVQLSAATGAVESRVFLKE